MNFPTISKYYKNIPTSQVPRACFSAILLVALISLLQACDGSNIDNATRSKAKAPQGLIATAGARINVLNWSGVPGATSYSVYWSNTAQVTAFNGVEERTERPHFEHRELSNDVPYYYVVAAHIPEGETAISQEVSATPHAAAPEKPQLPEIKAGDARTTLRWEPVAGATNYRLYWDTQPEVTTTANRIDNVNSPFVHSELINGQAYYYFLVVENQRGLASASDEISALPQKQLPTAPIITTAVANSGQLSIHWQDVSNAETFDLYWNTSGAVSENDSVITSVTSPYIFAPLLEGQRYYFRIRARNSAGNSVLSNEVEFMMPGPANISTLQVASPPAPLNVGIIPNDGRLDLDWPPITEAASYNIYWRSGDAGGVTTSDAKISNVLPPYIHIGLQNGVQYHYRITAINDGGESPLSVEMAQKPQVIIPGVPAGLKAITSDSTIEVRWIGVMGATSYDLYLNDEKITAVTSPHSLSGLQNGTPYTIQIKAINNGRESEYSQALTATPQQPVPQAPGQVVAQAGDGQTLIQWDSATPQTLNNATETPDPITGYRVYYSEHKEINAGKGQLINNATPEQGGDSRWQLIHNSLAPDNATNNGAQGLTNGKTYYYIVTAVNAHGEIRASTAVWAKPHASIPGVTHKPAIIPTAI